MANVDRVIRDRVQSFVDELTALVRQEAVESVQEALGSAGPSRRRPGRPAGSATTTGSRRTGRARRKGEKRSPNEIQALQDALLAAIKKAPRQRKAQLAQALSASSKDLMLVTNKLLDAGLIRKKGVKRATQYFAK